MQKLKIMSIIFTNFYRKEPSHDKFEGISAVCTAKTSMNKGHSALRTQKNEGSEEKKSGVVATTPVSVNASEILPTE